MSGMEDSFVCPIHHFGGDIHGAETFESLHHLKFDEFALHHHRGLRHPHVRDMRKDMLGKIGTRDKPVAPTIEILRHGAFIELFRLIHFRVHPSLPFWLCVRDWAAGRFPKAGGWLFIFCCCISCTVAVISASVRSGCSARSTSSGLSTPV